MLQNLRTNPGDLGLGKNPYRLWPAPEGVRRHFGESFEQALAGRRRALVIGCLRL